MTQPRVFVSAVSRELGSYRKAVEEILRLDGCHSVHQEVFSLTDETIIEMLREKIASCDAVVCLVGHRYGGEPREPLVGYDRHSYTQFEWVFGKERGLPVYVLLTHDEQCPEPDPGHREEPEPKEIAALQRAFRERVSNDRDYRVFAGLDELKHLVLSVRFPWKRAGATIDWDAQRLARQERVEALGDAFGLEPTEGALHAGLPEYARHYLDLDLAEAQRLALAEAHRLGQEAEDKPAAIARAYWVAGLADRLQHPRGDEAIEDFGKARAFIDQASAPRLWVRITAALGGMQHARGRFAAARETLEAAADASADAFGPDHRLTLMTRNNLAMTWNDLGRPDLAEPLARGVLDARQRTLGRTHPHTVSARNVLAVSLGRQGKPAEAEAQYLQTYQLCEEHLGRDHRTTLDQLFNLINFRIDHGDLFDVEEHYRDLLQRTRRIYGDNHERVGVVLNGLAWVLCELDEHADAEPLAKEAVQVLNLACPDDRDTLAARHTLATIELSLGKHARAAKRLERLIRDQERSLGPGHDDTLLSRCDHAKALGQLPGRAADAAAEAGTALWLATEHRGAKAAITVECAALQRFLANTDNPNTTINAGSVG